MDAQALPSLCRLNITFENGVSGRASGDYQLGIKFNKSKVRAKGGHWVPLKAKGKTVWSSTLKGEGSTDSKRATLILKEPCKRMRQFAFHTCWRKKTGPNRKKTCVKRRGMSKDFKAPKDAAGEWKAVYRLVDQHSPPFVEPKISVSSMRKANPRSTKCTLKFRVKNRSTKGAIAFRFGESKVRTSNSPGLGVYKGGVWVPMPKTPAQKSGIALSNTPMAPGEVREGSYEAKFREPCHRHRQFKIKACFQPWNARSKLKCNTIGLKVDGKTVDHKPGSYVFDLNIEKKKGKYIHLKAFD
jgi:hypothetical protein